LVLQQGGKKSLVIRAISKRLSLLEPFFRQRIRMLVAATDDGPNSVSLSTIDFGLRTPRAAPSCCPWYSLLFPILPYYLRCDVIRITTKVSYDSIDLMMSPTPDVQTATSVHTRYSYQTGFSYFLHLYIRSLQV
jgi:hypothetical protein